MADILDTGMDMFSAPRTRKTEQELQREGGSSTDLDTATTEEVETNKTAAQDNNVDESQEVKFSTASASIQDANQVLDAFGSVEFTPAQIKQMQEMLANQEKLAVEREKRKQEEEYLALQQEMEAKQKRLAELQEQMGLTSPTPAPNTNDVPKSPSDVSNNTQNQAAPVQQSLDVIQEELEREFEATNRIVDPEDDVNQSTFMRSVNGINKLTDRVLGTASNLGDKGLTALGNMKRTSDIDKKFSDAKKITSKGFNYKVILKPDMKEALVVSYAGSNDKIVIPKELTLKVSDKTKPEGYKMVAVPITAISPNFFKLSKVASKLNTVTDLENSDLAGIPDVLVAVQLPKYLTYIPPKIFSVKRIGTVFIGEAVTAIAPDAFDKCKIGNIVFLGKCPIGFNKCNLEGTKIFYLNKNYESSFRGIPGATFKAR